MAAHQALLQDRLAAVANLKEVRLKLATAKAEQEEGVAARAALSEKCAVRLAAAEQSYADSSTEQGGSAGAPAPRAGLCGTAFSGVAIQL